MKLLLSGRKKFITIPLVVILGFFFLPFTIAVLFVWFINRNVKSKIVRRINLAAIAILILFFGGTWIANITSPSKFEDQRGQTQPSKNIQSYPNQSQPTKKIEFSPSPKVLRSQTSPSNPNIQLAKVVRVIDGDTIEVDLGEGNIKKVRYIGINTPEIDDSRMSECFGKEAKIKNKELVENSIVKLEKDISETDKYGRLLRYVYKGDLFISRILVAEGYAHASSYPPDVKYQDILNQAEKQARLANKGLWGSCSTSLIQNKKSDSINPTLAQTNGNKSIKSSRDSRACKYSCSGPDRNCSDFPSHAEAQEFFNCCGFTAENDPMNLDSVGIGDGIACESLK